MKRQLEIFFIRFAAWLLDRNVERAMQISRRDNNYIEGVVFELTSIADRMQDKYEHIINENTIE